MHKTFFPAIGNFSANLQLPTKIVGKVENERLDFNNI